MSLVESFQVKHLTVEIHYDHDPINPREEFDTVGRIVHWHRNYNFGERMQPEDARELVDEISTNGGVYLPLFLYDHSGITMRTSPFSCRWDSGQVGFIYADSQAVDKEFGGDKEMAEKCLQAEVKTYDQFLTGDVYGFMVKDENDNILDSCWGFYGIDYIREESRFMAESCAADETFVGANI